jgi:hypothetical protein
MLGLMLNAILTSGLECPHVVVYTHVLFAACIFAKKREHFADLIYFLLPLMGVVSTNAPGSPHFVLKTGVV